MLLNIQKGSRVESTQRTASKHTQAFCYITMASNAENGYKLGYSSAILGALERRTAAGDAAHLLPHLKPASQILDLGCGPGSITVDFAKVATEGSVTGVDISPESIAVARQRVEALETAAAARDDPQGDNQLGEITFQELNVLQGLPFEDNTFDAVYAGQVFVHLLAGEEGTERSTAVMREVYRVLKPGGVIATRDASAYHWFPKSRTADKEDMLLKLTKSVLGFAKLHGGEVPVVIGAAGFDPVKMNISASTRVVSGREKKALFGKMVLARLAATEPRDAALGDGRRVEEIEHVKATVEAWIKDDFAWQVGVHTDVLAFK